MSSKYDKQIAISHEQEGSYSRRQVNDFTPASQKSPTTTYHTERYVVPADSSRGTKSSRQLARRPDTSDDDDDNYEEWTTSKRKINHTTRQVETRVSRQLLVEDGKVIADSGPQVTTRIKEDNKVEECEKEKTPKNKKAFEALEAAPESSGDTSGRVLGEKKEIQRVSREVREENMQYHDERFKELSGRDVHRRAIKAPHELMTIHDEHERHSKGAPRGKMVHYTNKGKKYQDTDEILEVAKLAIDGSVTKEVKRTRHHEEFSEDEKPDEQGEAEALRAKPIVERSSRRHVDYVNDFDDTHTPDSSDAEGRSGRAQERKRTAANDKLGRGRPDDEAFPRYEIDPLLNSLRDEDFKPADKAATYSESSRRRRIKEHSPVLVRDASPSSASSDGDHDERRRPYSPARDKHSHQHQQQQAVEIPEEYRVNKQRLMSGKHSSSGRRSQSPSVRQVHKSSSSSSSRPAAPVARREDASVQARLTDEEDNQIDAHEKTARYLQRQSTPNSSRHYYYGEPKHKANTKKRTNSITSLSSSSTSSVSNYDKHAPSKQRRDGAHSRDSGFRSPAQRAQTPSSQIYSVSSKTANKHNKHTAVSPTPTQRSVKTTTTTMSAGLKDRPLSPEHHADSDDNDQRNYPKRPHRSSKYNNRDYEQQQQQQKQQKQQHQSRRAEKCSYGPVDDMNNKHLLLSSENGHNKDDMQAQQALDNYKRRQRHNSTSDTVSVSSLQDPNATKIKVPYKRMIEIEKVPSRQQQQQVDDANNKVINEERASLNSKVTNEMSLRDDIENLSKRLANIRRANGVNNNESDHFDYKTVVANVHSSGPKYSQVIGAYNVQIVEQNSPFTNKIQLKHTQPTEDGDNNVNKYAQVSSDSGAEETTNTSNENNNNETEFKLEQYNFKYRAIPALVEPNVLFSAPNLCENEQEQKDDDKDSQISLCSLQSSRTYNVRTTFDDAQQNCFNSVDRRSNDNNNESNEFNINVKNPAWIFDPRDGSSTAIAPPPKPKKPPTPEMQTEELVQAPGGRSYYLELVDKRPTTSQADDGEQDEKATNLEGETFYSRWNSQGALNCRELSNKNMNTFINWTPTRSQRAHNGQNNNNSSQEHSNGEQQRRANTNSMNKINCLIKNRQPIRRQLPFAMQPSSLASSSIALDNRSKSSSCLLNVTKPSKYSMYGGFRKPDENKKPVPRLSYSRAIGPRSQRKTESQSKTPSRYLKMR